MRLLVRLPNWLGDALLARPALHALRRLAPAPETWAIGPAAVLELLAADGLFDRAAAWPAPGAERARLLADARRWRADAALVMPPSFSSAWFAWRAGARVRVAFAGDGRSPLLTRAVRRPARGERHLSDEYRDLARRLGAPDAEPGALPLPAAAFARADALLAELGLAGARVALLAPGAIYGPAKRWPVERFRAVAERLEQHGFRPLVCGGPDDAAICRSLAGGRLPSLAGRTDLLAQAGLCARAGLAVGNDSGFAHLAAAVGTPTVVVFGSTSSAWTAPLGRAVRVVQRPPVCAPCFQRTCRIGYACLERVAVDEVWRACAGLAA